MPSRGQFQEAMLTSNPTVDDKITGYFGSVVILPNDNNVG